VGDEHRRKGPLPLPHKRLSGNSRLPWYRHCPQPAVGDYRHVSLNPLLPKLFPLIPHSTALIIDTLGSGFGASTRSLVTAMVHPSNIGKLYTSIAVFDTLGALVGGPSISIAFQLGIKFGGGWIGLPFLLLAVLSAAVTVVVFMVRLAPDAGYEPLNGEGEAEGEAEVGEEDSLLAAGPR